MSHANMQGSFLFMDLKLDQNCLISVYIVSRGSQHIRLFGFAWLSQACPHGQEVL